MVIGCDYEAVNTATSKMAGACSDYQRFETSYENLKSEIPQAWEGAEAQACIDTLEDAQTDVTKLNKLLTQMEQWMATLRKNYEENEAAGQQFYQSMKG